MKLTGSVPADPLRVEAISSAGLLVPPFAEIERPADVPEMGAQCRHGSFAEGHALIRRTAASVKLHSTTPAARPGCAA